MRKFKIPVSWEMCGIIEIEADTLKEAIERAKENEDALPLPDDGEYIDASFVIDEELARVWPENTKNSTNK